MALRVGGEGGEGGGRKEGEQSLPFPHSAPSHESSRASRKSYPFAGYMV